MKTVRLLNTLRPLPLAAALACALLAAPQPGPASAQTPPAAPPVALASPDPHANETKAQRDARMGWWRAARFGLFIHWGLYAVPAGRYGGKPVGGLGEWIMHDAHIPVAAYADYAGQFDPERFNADQWVSIAKAAGMKYIVMTAKHHEGFAMFPTKVDDFNIVARTPFKRDPIGEMSAACRKAGIKFGVYYSQAQDWHHAGGAAYGGHWDPAAQDGDLHQYVRTVAAPQVAELLTRYHPAVLWWDTPVAMSREDIQALTAAFAQDPGLIANNRLGGGVPGDTETPEQTIPSSGFPGKDWETCMTINDTWGYKTGDTHFKDVTTLIRNLILIAAGGGNYLLNVGPTAEGVIPAPEAERLQAVGKWMKTNGEAIYGTSTGPFRSLPWGYCTQKSEGADTILYLHAVDWPRDGRMGVPGLRNAIRSAYLLDGGRSLPTDTDAAGVTLTVPMAAPDPVSSTVVLKIVGPPVVTQTSLSQDASGVLKLTAEYAETRGAVRLESDFDYDNVGYWTNPADWVEWPVQITKPGTFTVTAEIAALGSGSFTVEVNGPKKQAARVPVGEELGPMRRDIVTGTAPNTGDYGKYRTVTLGTLTVLQAGRVTVAVHPVPAGWQPMNLRSLTLTPVR